MRSGVSQGIGGVFREYDSSHVQNEDEVGEGEGEGASRERETHLNAEMEEERKIIYEQVGIDVPTAPHRILQNGLAGRKILNSGNDCDIARAVFVRTSDPQITDDILN